MDQRTWRTGIDPTTDWQRRAKTSHCITAWRSFEQTGAKRWLWIQATPVVDSADAASALSQLPERMLRNLRAKVRVVDEREVPPPAPLTTETAWAWWQCWGGEDRRIHQPHADRGLRPERRRRDGFRLGQVLDLGRDEGSRAVPSSTAT
jgi:hypothetical protein